MRYPVYVIIEDGSIKGFKSRARARGFFRAEEFAMMFEDGDWSRIDTDYIVNKYNEMHPATRQDKPFQTRAEAMRWFDGVIGDIATPGEAPGPVAGPVDNNHPSVRSTAMAAKKAAKKKTPAKKAAAKKSTGERTGRPSQYSGKKIFKISKENPRKAGTSGHRSFALITPGGMKYEDYIAKGGVRRDLEWDIEHGYVRVS